MYFFVHLWIPKWYHSYTARFLHGGISTFGFVNGRSGWNIKENIIHKKVGCRGFGGEWGDGLFVAKRQQNYCYGIYVALQFFRPLYYRQNCS